MDFWGKNGLILGQKWADFGRFGYVALPLGLGGSSGAFLGDALRALYLPSARLFVVPGIGIPPIIKIAQNGVKRAQEGQRKTAPGTEYERRQIIKPSTVKPSTAFIFTLFFSESRTGSRAAKPKCTRSSNYSTSTAFI